MLVAFMTEGTVSFDLRPDLRVFSIALIVGVLTGILFGLAPILYSLRQDPAIVLQQGSRSLAGGTGKLSKTLIVSQVALSVVLLLGAGLLVRTFEDLRSLTLGFDKHDLLEIIVNAKPGGYKNLDTNSYHRQLIERVSSLPGVRSVSLADISIPAPGLWQEKVSLTSEDPNTGFHVMANEVTIWPGFFNAMGIRLMSGRDFQVTDDEHLDLVILSKSLAEHLFPNGNPIGQHIRFGFMPDFQNLEIVGVADDARILDLREPTPSLVYFSYVHAQSVPWADVYVRAKGDPEALAMTVGHESESLGHEYSLRTATVDQMVSRLLVNERVIAMLSSLFAGLALLLASIGLYGLMSYGVTRRTREIGVRVALGAQPGGVRWMVLRETLALTLLGVAVGVPSGLAATRLITSMLFGVSPSDFSTLAISCLLLLVVALFAGYLPARRASLTDPVVALRTE